MRLKVAYERSSGGVVDIIVTADATATVGDVATAIAAVDPQRTSDPVSGELTLSVAHPGAGEFVTLDQDRTLGESPVASGHGIRLVTAASVAGDRSAGRPVVAVAKVTSGVDRGKEFSLRPGTYIVGRDPAADIVLADRLVSKRHARLDVGATIELVDLNSANGILVDGGVVPRLAVQPGQPVTLGDTAISFLPTEQHHRAQAPTKVQAGAIPFNRSPRVEERYPGRQYPRPEVPRELDEHPFPWLMLVAPVILGLSMYLFTGRLISLLFVAMTPIMLAGNYVMSRQRTARQRDRAIAKFDGQLTALEAELSQQRPVEQRVRLAEAPSVKRLLDAGLEHDTMLFTRRPEHWNFLNLRLGVGDAPSRNTVAPPAESDPGLPEFTARLDDLVDRQHLAIGVPITEDPLTAGAMGVVGDPASAAAAMRGLLVQLLALHSPAELVVAAVAGAASAPEFEWLKWLPHTSSPHSPFGSAPLADSAATVGRLVSELEDLVSARLGGDVGAQNLRGPMGAELAATAGGAYVGASTEVSAPPMPVIALLVTDDAPGLRSRLVQLAERGASVGIIPFWLAKSAEDLPAACRTYLDVSTGLSHARVEFVRHGQAGVQVEAEGTSRDAALRFARSLSGLVDSGALVADASDLPQSVTLLSLLGAEMAQTSATVIDRWRQNDSIHDRSGTPRPLTRPRTLRALVGQAGADALHLDLRSQGPHALVGGTTGSGKSEFLQAWVLAMAAEHSPDRLTFLFVDYKGGAAFADCVRLPHSVGLVTDLSPHLVRRALTSLRAELRHREEVLAGKKAKDLLELERRGDPECPPALVLVIDEFAALVSDVPDFVDGVVNIAQRGRSLGIHLIMATQRPSGVIKDNLRANTNLRIALRMADEADSTDVVGAKDAAGFDPAVPGRGLAKTGPGRLSLFQSAYAGGWTRDEPDASVVTVHELRFGAESLWAPPAVVDVAPADPGPTDQARLVSNINAAAQQAGVPAPRLPWRPELARVVDLAPLSSFNDEDLVIGLADRPADQIQEPVYFRPDSDGHLAIYGTGGSGKSVLLRTLAAAAGMKTRGGPVDVYGLDFGAGGLRMLEVLPHVGAVISGDDSERVVRLLRMLKGILDDRSRRYPAVVAGSVVDYRKNAGKPQEARILVLLDGFPAFRAEYETVVGRSQWYATFQQLLMEGRTLGIHVVLTADRPGSIPGAIASSVPRRVVLRLAEETMYTLLDVDTDVLTATSPPGRAIVDGVEVQVALLGGSGNVADQSAAVTSLAGAIRGAGRVDAPPVGALPAKVLAHELPRDVGGLPVMGISDENLEPLEFQPRGVLLVAGGPGSGRSNAVAVLIEAVVRAEPDTRSFYLGNRRSTLAARPGWEESALTTEAVADLAKRLSSMIPDVEDEHVTIVVESVSDFYSTSADAALVELFKAVKRTEHLLIAESETSTWASSWPLYAEVKAARRGIVLQPETIEGDTILRTTFPRISRAEFPPGRGFFVQFGKVVRVQLALVEPIG